MPASTLHRASLFAGLALAAPLAWAQAPEPTRSLAPSYSFASLGATAGYGAPFGWGLDLGGRVRPQLDVTVGAGFSLTGGKLGMGARYYLAPAKAVSAFVGANLAYSTGLHRVMVQPGNRYSIGGSTYGQPTVAVVNFGPAYLLHLRSGLRWQAAAGFALLGTLGYGFVLNTNTVEYVYVTNNPPPALRNAVDFISPGGLEVSAGVAFALHRR